MLLSVESLGIQVPISTDPVPHVLLPILDVNNSVSPLSQVEIYQRELDCEVPVSSDAKAVLA